MKETFWVKSFSCPLPFNVFGVAARSLVKVEYSKLISGTMFV
jgi:hypothetical protein